MWKVQFLEPLDAERLFLRRYRSVTAEIQPPCNNGAYHNAMFHLGDFPKGAMDDLKVDDSDPRWPRQCQKCHYAFQPEDTHQVFRESLWKSRQTDFQGILSEAPMGSLWDASWMSHEGRDSGYTGPDGISLMCVTPGGHWCIDSQASNCDKDQWYVLQPGDEGYEEGHAWRRFVRTHYCWVRHGDPREGILHVDKNGVTCGAGAGSIQAGNWHGYLHNNHLHV